MPAAAIDTIVHSVCKLLGHLGSQPEYGKGVRGFPEYLKELLEEVEEVGDASEEEDELKATLSVRLSRQVGSRYFVTSRNAGRILCLARRATQFLEVLQVSKELNNLERDVLNYLKTPHVLALLKVDGLIYDQIYADLMILMKSTKLGKMYLDMNVHYLELSRHLELLGNSPRLLLDPSIKVFPSEPRLYGENRKLNHRIHQNSPQIRSRLYSHDDFDESCTFPLIKKASERMLDKLKNYKAEQLPGGKLWNPDTDTRKALAKIQPTNDLCEGILGLNDWLQKRTANFSQRTVSGMVEVLKNSTMPWFWKQNKDFKDKIIILAKKRSNQVIREEKELLEGHRRKRKMTRKAEEEKARVKRAKQAQKQEELSKIEIIPNITDLEDALSKAAGATPKQIEAAKIYILKQQLEVRLSLCGKRLTLSHKGRKKTSEDLLRELTVLIEEEEEKRLKERELPEGLNGRKIKHKLKDDATDIAEWYDGEIVGMSENIVTIEYVGYTDTFEWDKVDIAEDIFNSDLIFL